MNYKQWYSAAASLLCLAFALYAAHDLVPAGFEYPHAAADLAFSREDAKRLRLDADRAYGSYMEQLQKAFADLAKEKQIQSTFEAEVNDKQRIALQSAEHETKALEDASVAKYQLKIHVTLFGFYVVAWLGHFAWFLRSRAQ
ncbi:MAG TPA: hypothetical protein VF713_11465 [Thermoanaerobaculia bacterium]